MPMYRMEKSWDGSHRIRQTSAEQEVGAAVGTAIGWALGAGAGGVGMVARNMRERKAQRIMEEFTAATEAGDGQRMLRAADELVRRWPSEDFGHELRARALVVLERGAEAVGALDRAVQLGMDPYEASMGRAAAYEVGGQTGKAIQEYTALVNHPDSPQARAVGLLGRAHCLVELDDLEQALNDANQAIAVQPDEEAYFVRAVIHGLRGDDELCLADMGRAIRLDPDNPDLRGARADKLEALGRTEEAAADRAMVTAARGNDVREGASEAAVARADTSAGPRAPSSAPRTDAEDAVRSVAQIADDSSVRGDGPDVANVVIVSLLGFGALVFLVGLAAGEGGAGTVGFLFIVGAGVWFAVRRSIGGKPS